jgi:hypothetical protein
MVNRNHVLLPCVYRQNDSSCGSTVCLPASIVGLLNVFPNVLTTVSALALAGVTLAGEGLTESEVLVTVYKSDER